MKMTSPPTATCSALALYFAFRHRRWSHCHAILCILCFRKYMESLRKYAGSCTNYPTGRGYSGLGPWGERRRGGGREDSEPAMRLEITGPRFGSLNGKRQFFIGGRPRKF
jgi:hypothetical protein